LLNPPQIWFFAPGFTARNRGSGTLWNPGKIPGKKTLEKTPGRIPWRKTPLVCVSVRRLRLGRALCSHDNETGSERAWDGNRPSHGLPSRKNGGTSTAAGLRCRYNGRKPPPVLMGLCRTAFAGSATLFAGLSSRGPIVPVCHHVGFFHAPAPFPCTETGVAPSLIALESSAWRYPRPIRGLIGAMDRLIWAVQWPVLAVQCLHTSWGAPGWFFYPSRDVPWLFGTGFGKNVEDDDVREKKQSGESLERRQRGRLERIQYLKVFLKRIVSVVLTGMAGKGSSGAILLYFAF
jgi:hypothetical protein